jgi:tRNA 2-thiouridine synthesizing protein A
VSTVDHTLDAPGLACIDLTPLIATTMRELQPGQVLEVRTDDPAARVGVPAWCRLTSNPLLHTIEDRSRPDITVFHITRKAS